MQTRFFPDSTASRFGLTAIVAAMLMLSLSATVAFAQAEAVDEGDDAQYEAVCQNILGAVGDITQGQKGNATAVSEQYSEAVAEVAQEQGVSIEQINECLNGAAGTGGDDTGDDTGDNTGDDTANTESREADVLAETIPEQKVLANTGGSALLLPALGLLLISSVTLRNLLRR